jgi:hypothetical protein
MDEMELQENQAIYEETDLPATNPDPNVALAKSQGRIAIGADGLPTVKLYDGRTAKFFRRNLVKDSIFAHDQSKHGNDSKFGSAILSRILTIDGSPVKLEDVHNMLQSDYNVLLGIVRGNFTI